MEVTQQRNDMNECIKASLLRTIDRTSLWGTDEKKLVADRLLQSFAAASVKSLQDVTNGGSKQHVDPELARTQQVTELWTELDKELRATIECRKRVPINCVHHLAREIRLQCTYWQKVAVQRDTKEWLRGVKAANSKTQDMKTQREMDRALIRQLAMSATELNQSVQSLVEQRSKLETAATIYASQQTSNTNRLLFSNDV